MQYSRTDYLSQVCSHQQYYEQFITPTVAALLDPHTERIANSKDRFFNDLPLGFWDRLAVPTLAGDRELNRRLKEAGDYLTLAGGVCILKACATQLRSYFEHTQEVA